MYFYLPPLKLACWLVKILAFSFNFILIFCRWNWRLEASLYCSTKWRVWWAIQERNGRIWTNIYLRMTRFQEPTIWLVVGEMLPKKNKAKQNKTRQKQNKRYKTKQNKTKKQKQLATDLKKQPHHTVKYAYRK